MKKEESQKRRLFKQNARKTVKHHYFVLVMLCLVAVYFGAEFGYVTSQTNDTYNILTGRAIEGTEFAVTIDGSSILETALEKMGIDTTAIKESRLAEEREEIRQSGSQSLIKIRGGSRGFLSRVVKYFASGNVVDMLINAGVSVFHSETVAMAILIIAGLLVTLFIWAFLKNVYIAILRRMFLEARTYRTVPFSHVLFFRAVDRWKKASLSMVRLSVCKLLWWFTVFGGVMHGPWLPVYGSGVSLIVVLLARWRGTPYKEAFFTLLLCGFLEYMTSYYLEVTKGMRWWDYTGYILNLNGRICAEGLIVFVVGGMAAVYVLVPLIDTTLSRINTKTLSMICMVLVVSFAADMVYSHYVPNTGEGITDYEAYKKQGVYLPVQEEELYS